MPLTAWRRCSPDYRLISSSLKGCLLLWCPRLRIGPLSHWNFCETEYSRWNEPPMRTNLVMIVRRSLDSGSNHPAPASDLYYSAVRGAGTLRHATGTAPAPSLWKTLIQFHYVTKAGVSGNIPLKDVHADRIFWDFNELNIRYDGLEFVLKCGGGYVVAGWQKVEFRMEIAAFSRLNIQNKYHPEAACSAHRIVMARMSARQQISGQC